LSSLDVLIPVSIENPKTGLSSVLSLEERRLLTLVMLRRVVRAVSPYGEPVVVSPNRLELDHAELFRCSDPLNPALEKAVDSVGMPVLILPSDLPYITSEDVGSLVGGEGDVVISPGNRGGTNALLLRERIALGYNGDSYDRHTGRAMEKGLDVETIYLENVYHDIDTPEDLRSLCRFIGKRDGDMEVLDLPLELIRSIMCRCP